MRTLIFIFLGVQGAAALAQAPRINTFFPIGGKAGSVVEAEVRGSGLDGAELLLSDRPGVSGMVLPGSARADETNKPIWQSKCGSCHELRSPANRSLSPAQWAATVDRMIKVNQAPISALDADKIVQYLQSAARAGRLAVEVKIAQDTKPGMYELRLVTPRGVSTAGRFEVGALPEVIGMAGTSEHAQTVMLPCVANGSITANGQRHGYKFKVQKGQRIVFDFKGYRYNDATQLFFNPILRLFDMKGHEIAESHWGHDIDPLLDWTAPADGDYVMEASDLLGRGNPGNVYRLTMMQIPSNASLPADPTGAAYTPLAGYARPDAITLRPGLTTAVQIVINRRDGVEGDIAVTAEGLPAGVRAGLLSIPADRGDGWLLLSASPDAPNSAGPVRIILAGKIKTATSRAVVIGQEITRLGNDWHSVDRTQITLAVRGQAQFHAELATPGPVRVLPKDGVPFKVRIKREKGFQGGVTVRIDGLPSGWVANWEYNAPDKEEVSLLIRPDGNDTNPFMKRSKSLPPITAVVQAFSDDFLFVVGTFTVIQ